MNKPKQQTTSFYLVFKIIFVNVFLHFFLMINTNLLAQSEIVAGTPLSHEEFPEPSYGSYISSQKTNPLFINAQVEKQDALFP